jgi:Mn-dependent DtxR family transcriptional regulator
MRGRLTKKQLVGFLGVSLQEVDSSLDKLSDQGYLKYEKVKNGKYSFTFYPAPVREIQLTK